ncbi:hypothetical protein APA_3354 [Pseudanabaena sp. lw0831]|nr:hypothetical protein APA_3354 [Pseudanabaena sp. lw0831]
MRFWNNFFSDRYHQSTSCKGKHNQLRKFISLLWVGSVASLTIQDLLRT